MKLFKGNISIANERTSLKKTKRKIAFFLKRSFFSIEEILGLKKKKALRTLVKIFKTESKKISHKEAKSILQAFKLIKKHKKIKLNSVCLRQVLQKFFNFSRKIFLQKSQDLYFTIKDFFNYVFNFCLSIQKNFRN